MEPNNDHTCFSQMQNSPMMVENSPLEPQTESLPAKKSARGANFTQEEDKLLVSAWLNTCIDAIQGTNQKHAQL